MTAATPSSEVYNPKLGVEGDSDSGFLRCTARPIPAGVAAVMMCDGCVQMHGRLVGMPQAWLQFYGCGDMMLV